MSYLDGNGLATLWAKIKQYVRDNATSSIPEAIEYYNIFREEREKGKHSLKVTALFDPSDDIGGFVYA